jgi:hypothetical protein
VFRHTRERLERIERLLDGLAKELASKPTTAPLEPTAVLGQAFGAMASNQGELFHSLTDLALKSAARRMGIRGGTKRALTATRQRDGRFERARRITQAENDCALCEDENYRHPTIPMIIEHRRHEGQREARRTQNGYSSPSQSSTDTGSAYANGLAAAGAGDGTTSPDS